MIRGRPVGLLASGQQCLDTAVRSYEPVPSALPLTRRSVSWEVLAEPVAFLGGARAVLLQVAHPKVGAGVADHSTYVSDPWARLFRTVDVMAKLSFGPPESSARQARLLERMHRRVVGTTPGGQPYDALDPALLLWVWATLVETGLTMYELLRRPLTAAERDQYYEEWKLVAHGCGVPPGTCPATWPDFAAYFARCIVEELAVTEPARSVAHATMALPIPRPVGPLASVPNRLFTVGLMPAPLREQFGFDWDEDRQRRLDRTAAATRALLRATPRAVRESGMRYIVRRQEPLRWPWLQRKGAALTAERMRSFEPTHG